MAIIPDKLLIQRSTKHIRFDSTFVEKLRRIIRMIRSRLQQELEILRKLSTFGHGVDCSAVFWFPDVPVLIKRFQPHSLAGQLFTEEQGFTI